MPSPSPGWSKNPTGRCLPGLLRKGQQNHQHPPGPQNRRFPFGKNRRAGSWYTIYHHLPVVKGVSSNPSINQPTSGKRTSMLVTSLLETNLPVTWSDFTFPPFGSIWASLGSFHVKKIGTSQAMRFTRWITCQRKREHEHVWLHDVVWSIVWMDLKAILAGVRGQSSQLLQIIIIIDRSIHPSIHPSIHHHHLVCRRLNI